MPSKARPVRIVIVDEHPIFREGLRRLLETVPSLEIVGQASSASAPLVIQQLAPDVLLLGLSSSASASLDLVQRIADTGTAVRTILLTRAVDSPEVLKALGLGAQGVVPKDTTAEILFRSIESVMAGQYWVGGAPASNVMTGLRQFDTARRRAKAFGLTQRELEIVRAVMDGDTNKAMAKRFGISENTVKRHLTHIFNKVGASTRVELALFAAHHHLLGNS